MSSKIVQAFKKNTGTGWFLFYCLASLNLLYFLSLLLLLHPMWYMINAALIAMLSVSLPWLSFIIILLVINSVYFVYILSRYLMALKRGDTFTFSAFQKIFPFPVLLFWNYLLHMLIGGVNQELVVAWRELARTYPWLLLIVLLASIIFIVPMLKKLQSLKGRVLLFMAVLLILFLYIYDFSSPAIIAGPYLQRVTERSATVTWICNRKSVSWITYGRNELSKKILRSEAGLFKLSTLHRVTLDGLEPGTEYRYRITVKPVRSYYAYHIDYDDEFSSNLCTFRTLDTKKESIRFLVFNDIHEGIQTIPSLIDKSGFDTFDFIFINGDYFHHIDSEEQLISQLLHPLGKKLGGGIPFYLVRGNHEARGIFAHRLPEYLNCQGCSYYYSFSHGPARFVILDSGEDKADSHEEYSGLADFDRYRDEQTAWLEREMAKGAYRSAQYRIVLMHIPPFVESGRYDEYGVREVTRKWVPLFRKGKVDLLIAGHTHKHNLLPPDRDHPFPIVIGGGPGADSTVIRILMDKKGCTIEMLDRDGSVIRALSL